MVDSARDYRVKASFRDLDGRTQGVLVDLGFDHDLAGFCDKYLQAKSSVRRVLGLSGMDGGVLANIVMVVGGELAENWTLWFNDWRETSEGRAWFEVRRGEPGAMGGLDSVIGEDRQDSFLDYVPHEKPVAKEKPADPRPPGERSAEIVGYYITNGWDAEGTCQALDIKYKDKGEALKRVMIHWRVLDRMNLLDNVLGDCGLSPKTIMLEAQTRLQRVLRNGDNKEVVAAGRELMRYVSNESKKKGEDVNVSSDPREAVEQLAASVARVLPVVKMTVDDFAAMVNAQMVGLRAANA